MTDIWDDIQPVTDGPESPEPDTTRPESPDGGPRCEVCGVEIPWAGRGRKPKKCDEHKSRTSGRSDTGTPARGTRLDKRLAILTEDLTAEFTKFGKGLTPFLPVTGVVTVSRAPKTAEALVKIASKNSKVLDALEVATKVMPAFDLAETGVMVGTALMVDRRLLHPDAVIPSLVGVSEIWHDLYPEGDGRESDSPAQVIDGQQVGFPEQPVPPRFAKIT